MSAERPDNEWEGLPLYDRRNYRRSPSTLPGYRQGKSPVTKGKEFPPEVFTPEAIDALLDRAERR